MVCLLFYILEKIKIYINYIHEIRMVIEMNRIPLIAANWKMHKDSTEAVNFITELRKRCRDISDREILVCPSFTSLNFVQEECVGSNIKAGAQNIHHEEEGAYTGEISAKMIKELCEYVIIGHSERRQYFNETDDVINKKLLKAIEHGLKPVFCIGETLEERKADKTFEVLEKQIKDGLTNVNIKDLTIAYEPVWAIGTGETATPEQAEEVHKFIRELLEKLYDSECVPGVRIIYGGSVKPENIVELMEKDNIDGALVGGASLEVDSFFGIVNY